MGQECVLKLKNIVKKYGGKLVLNDISLDFYKRSIYALVGNNGVGKSTLLKIICGLVKPNGGHVEFADKKLKIGALIEEPGVFKDLTAYQNIEAKAICLGLSLEKSEIEGVLELVGLSGTDKKTVGKFSMGMKQRLGIALAVLGNPDILILDEPTNSLDPQGISDVRAIIERLRQMSDMCIIVSSHNLDELQKYATDYIVLSKTKVIKNCSARAFDEERGEIPVDKYFLKIIE